MSPCEVTINLPFNKKWLRQRVCDIFCLTIHSDGNRIPSIIGQIPLGIPQIVSVSLIFNVIYFQVCGDWPLGRRVHAQEGSEVEVLVRKKWQGLFQLRQGRFLMPNLLHDAQQTGHGKLVVVVVAAIRCVNRKLSWQQDTKLLEVWIAI